MVYDASEEGRQASAAGQRSAQPALGSENRMKLPIMLLMAMLQAAQPRQSRTSPTLDYAFFKERVQPILLKKRPGHARCVVCHDHRSPPLQPIAPGASTWNEEQSRQNFAVWKQFVVPGNPTRSRMLLHPLAEAAGGDRFHAGGKHWKSQSDSEWQTLAAWVRGETMRGAR